MSSRALHAHHKQCNTDVKERLTEYDTALQADHPSKHGNPYRVAEAELKAEQTETFDAATMPMKA